MMERAKIPSQRALAARAHVSRWQVQQLRQGNIDAMRLSILKKLAMALECSLDELLQTFMPEPLAPNTKIEGAANRTEIVLRQEYARLEKRLEQQEQRLRHQFQVEALRSLESWLTYWPTAAKAATERDGFDAKKLLPLVKPVERLVTAWGVTPIGTVGETLRYDPQQQQLARGEAAPGDPVRISHVGYRHGENLLQRANVVPLNPN